MAFDEANLIIRDRLPEWMRTDIFFTPTNTYSERFIEKSIDALLENFGLLRPIQVWKTLPTNYPWTYTHTDNSNVVTNESGNSISDLRTNIPAIVNLPNTKRPAHAKIMIQLKPSMKGIADPIEWIKIENAGQEIIFKDVDSESLIEIFTEDQVFMINKEEEHDQIEGSLKWLLPSQLNNPNDVPIDDENKETKFKISSSGEKFDYTIHVELVNPVYVTQQNIRVFSISALPIKFIKLYCYYCHDFNGKAGWKHVYTKNYKEEDRIVYDRITKQFDSEIFFVEIGYWGTDVALKRGFPQEDGALNPIFNINKNLDRWGKIYSMPRRKHKETIPLEDEYYTLPEFYNYPFEQDYWYEQRMANEYVINEDAVDNILIYDTNYSRLGRIKCIDPHVEDLHIYTETKPAIRSRRTETEYINPKTIMGQKEPGYATWDNINKMKTNKNDFGTITLENYSSESLNSQNYKAETLSLFFELEDYLPDNIEIKGIELQLIGATNIHSDNILLDERTSIELLFNNALDSIHIASEQQWPRDKNNYIIGGKDDLFGLESISRDQITNFKINLGFRNLHEKLVAKISIYDIAIKIHYKTLEEKFEVKSNILTRKMTHNETINTLCIDVENVGNIPVKNKDIYIIYPSEIELLNDDYYNFSLDVGEKIETINVQFKALESGIFDIIFIIDGKVYSNQVLVV